MECRLLGLRSGEGDLGDIEVHERIGEVLGLCSGLCQPMNPSVRGHFSSLGKRGISMIVLKLRKSMIDVLDVLRLLDFYSEARYWTPTGHIRRGSKRLM